VHVIYYGSSDDTFEEYRRLADAAFRDSGPKWNLITRCVSVELTVIVLFELMLACVASGTTNLCLGSSVTTFGIQTMT
jgi:hypothetical protein